MLHNIPKDKVLDVVRQGPTFPAKVAKQLDCGGDTVLVGAILSTLISTGEVKVSTLKIGGSPLYYLPEQVSRLEEFIDHLNDKDRKTFRLIKEKKVLQDDLQDPLIRVSLRTIKDFAKPFNLSIEGNDLLFWRFYAIAFDDAEALAKQIVKIPMKEQIIRPAESTKAILSQEPDQSAVIEAQRVIKTNPDVISEKHVVAQTILSESSDSAGVIGVVQPEMVIRDDSTSKSQSNDYHIASAQTAEGVKRGHHEVHHPEATHHSTHHPEHHSEHHDTSKSKSHHTKSVKTHKEYKRKVPSYDFFEVIKSHLINKGLDILSKEKIKRTEYDLILKNHDTNEYIYCKAKDKSAVSEGDLAPALIFAQSKKMPCLFLSTGELTKKAELMMSNELAEVKFERMHIKNG